MSESVFVNGRTVVPLGSTASGPTNNPMSAAEILAALLTVDGAGSGLDADKLDGLSSSAFVIGSTIANNMFAGNAGNATTTGDDCVGLGNGALMSLVSASKVVGIGTDACRGVTTGGNSIGLGYAALYKPGVNVANATTSGLGCVGIGAYTGQASATQRNLATAIGYLATFDGSYATAIGAGTAAGAAGSVAIGTDSGGNGASTTTANEIKLGTANHSATVAGKAAFGGAGSYGGGGTGTVFIANNSAVPGSNPTGGGVLYVEAGALKYRGSSGTVTVIAPA